MAQAKKFTWGATGLAIAVVIAAFVMWIAPSRQTSSAQDSARAAAPPLISRGYTDSPAGTAVVAGDPAGGTNLLELRIKDGQKVKRDEIIAVLSVLRWERRRPAWLIQPGQSDLASDTLGRWSSGFPRRSGQVCRTFCECA